MEASAATAAPCNDARADPGVLARFLRSLVKRGLVGVELATSYAHRGLKDALAQVLGAPWQRCTVLGPPYALNAPQDPKTRHPASPKNRYRA